MILIYHAVIAKIPFMPLGDIILSHGVKCVIFSHIKSLFAHLHSFFLPARRLSFTQRALRGIRHGCDIDPSAFLFMSYVSLPRTFLRHPHLAAVHRRSIHRTTPRWHSGSCWAHCNYLYIPLSRFSLPCTGG